MRASYHKFMPRATSACLYAVPELFVRCKNNFEAHPIAGPGPRVHSGLNEVEIENRQGRGSEGPGMISKSSNLH